MYSDGAICRGRRCRLSNAFSFICASVMDYANPALTCCLLQGHEGGYDMKVVFALRLPESDACTSCSNEPVVHSCVIAGLFIQFVCSTLEYCSHLKPAPNHFQLMTPSGRACCHLITCTSPAVTYFSQSTCVVAAVPAGTR